MQTHVVSIDFERGPVKKRNREIELHRPKETAEGKVQEGTSWETSAAGKNLRRVLEHVPQEYL